MIEPLAEAEAAAVEPLGRAAGRDLRRRQQVKGGSGRAARRGMVAAGGWAAGQRSRRRRPMVEMEVTAVPLLAGAKATAVTPLAKSGAAAGRLAKPS